MRYLITGGTGTLGNALTKKLLKCGHSVTIYSRDEYKQYNMKAEFKNSKLNFIVGDVRDREKTISSFRGMDRVIHAAAIKHVPVAEEDPQEAVKTNVLGTMNVIEACKLNGVKKAVLVATDKATHPVNLYGATKMVGEHLFISANQKSKTEFVCVRYGNVIGSRGSVIEYLLTKKPKTINSTDNRMTRFWLTIDQAVDLVMLAFKKAKRGEIIVPKAPASNVSEMFRWLIPDIKVIETGMRPCEKIHEVMVNLDESTHTKIFKDHFVIQPEIFGVKYDTKPFEYTSANARHLNREEFLKLI